MQTTVKKPGLYWVGVAYGALVGATVSMLYLLAYLIWATVDAAGTPEAVNTGALWIFGVVACAGGVIPAGITGGFMGAVMGIFYQSRSRRLSTPGAGVVGAVIGGMVLLFSYLSLRGLVGETDWGTFLGAYGGGADTVFLLGLYTLLVFSGSLLLSLLLNRRLPVGG